MKALSVLGFVLTGMGFLVSVIFWVPGVVNRKKMKEILGRRYLIIFLIYIANGPLLLFLGMVLLLFTHNHF